MKKFACLLAAAFVLILAAHTQSCTSEASPSSDEEQAASDSVLTGLRTQIDSLDNQLIEILSNRMKVCVAVGEYKKQHNIAVVQSNRYNEIVERLCKLGKEKGLSETFVKQIMETIHTESVSQQNALKDK